MSCKRVISAVVVMLSLSCQRRDLGGECVTGVSIPLYVDWETSGVSPQNVTALFYDSTTGDLVLEHYYEHNDNSVHSYVELPEGSYSVVVFNELRDQADNISITGHENLYTLSAYSSADDDVITRLEGDYHITQPGDFATAVLHDVEVDYDLLTTKADELTSVTTTSKVSTLDITVAVDGLNNALMPVSADLRNLSSSHLIVADSNSTDLSTIQFTFDTRTYDDDSQSDGVITASITTLGVIGDRDNTDHNSDESPLLLDIFFTLVDADATLVNSTIDVTDSLVFYTDDYGNIDMTLSITLPDTLPDVEAAGSGGSGFGSSVDDWEGVYVPLTL